MSIHGKARGGRGLPGKFDGDKTDDGVVRACRRRCSGAPAVERRAQGDVSGSGESASVLREARGGEAQLEFDEEGRRRQRSLGKNWGVWERVEMGRQRGSGEET